MLYIFILSVCIFFTPFVWYFAGLKRTRKTNPVNYCAEVNRLLEMD